MKLSVALILVLVDQATKFWAKGLPGNIKINEFFQIYVTENHGVAFSIPVPKFFSITLAIGISAWVIWRIIKGNLPKKEAWGSIFLLGGAVGNVIDRILQGFVTDFLSIGGFPVFNLADVWVNLGIGLILLSEFTKPE